MGITDFLLDLVRNEELYKQFTPDADARELQAIIEKYGLSPDDQRLLSDRDLSKLRVRVRAEFELDEDDEAAIWTIYAATGTIYIPPPPPPE